MGKNTVRSSKTKVNKNSRKFTNKNGGQSEKNGDNKYEKGILKTRMYAI